jgi:hypothetical protein
MRTYRYLFEGTRPDPAFRCSIIPVSVMLTEHARPWPYQVQLSLATAVKFIQLEPKLSLAAGR